MLSSLTRASRAARAAAAALFAGAGMMLAVTACAFPAAHAAEAGRVRIDGARAAALEGAADQGPIAPDAALDGMVLVLRRPADRQAAFDRLTEAQLDPASPLFHHWLTASEIGGRYGAPEADITKVVAWLRGSGLTVRAISPAATSIVFGGRADAVSRAFGVALRTYRMRGAQIQAAEADPSVPASLGGLVAGLAGLSGFLPHPLVKPRGVVLHAADGRWHAAGPSLTSSYNGTPLYDVGPADFATIYDVSPLRAGSTKLLGTGQTIALVEDSDMLASDWSSFRAMFGLSGYSGTLSTIHPGCFDPGRNGDEAETALDAEWSSSVAPNANVEIASCANTFFSGGIGSALSGLVNQKSPPQIISVSFGICEASLGSSSESYWTGLIQQGAAEGISIFVATGDGGAADCDQNATIATNGVAVNGLAASPYDVAVGGTDFVDTALRLDAAYWQTANTANLASALSYIPEIPWNDSCASLFLAAYEGATSLVGFCNSTLGANYLAPAGGGGGASIRVAKPAWQSGVPGIPADGARDLPDVSLFAAAGLWRHALLYCMSDTSQGGAACGFGSGQAVWANSAGGTSFASPSFAGVMALIDQRKGARQGNPGPRFYGLAQAPNATCNAFAPTASCLFHDVDIGNNDVACSAGSPNCFTGGGAYGVLSTSASQEIPAYAAAVGWDEASGLGSPDIANLVAAY